MGWADRGYDVGGGSGGGGGFRQALRRIFVEGDNFFSWSLPLFTAFAIRVRIHLLFVLFIVAELLWSLRPSGAGPAYVALGMSSLFVLVLLHEFGHCFACRWVGGEADQILMWPLGGLAFVLPPNTWQANLITTVGGPMVNVLLIPVTSVIFLVAGGPVDALYAFNPFQPGVVLGGLGSYWLAWAWWLHYLNLVLLGFNVLLPMFPLDGGRILQALLWRRMGFARATLLSANIGLVGAVVVGVIAVTGDAPRLLLGIAIFAGIVCWTERRKIQFMDGEWAAGGAGGGAGVGAGGGMIGYGGVPGPDPDPEPRPSRGEIRRQEREAREQAEVDRILAKIAESGLASLTRVEQRTLRKATERKRAQTERHGRQ